MVCVKQPWAWFIVNGYKDVENRNSPPPEARVGQPFMVLASSHKVTKVEYQDFLETVRDLRISSFPKSPDDFIYRAIVGSAVISRASRSSKSYWAARGQCHWELTRQKRIKPIKMKGQQALFFKAKI